MVTWPLGGPKTPGIVAHASRTGREMQASTLNKAFRMTLDGVLGCSLGSALTGRSDLASHVRDQEISCAAVERGDRPSHRLNADRAPLACDSGLLRARDVGPHREFPV